MNAPLRRTQLARRTASDGRLLAAALRLVARGGSAGTSLASIGLEAGFSRGLPAERFGSKAALLLALIDAMEAWAEDNVFAGMPAESGLDGLLARVEAHFRGCMDGPEAVGALYILSMESLTVVPELRPRLAAYFQGYRRAFEHHIRSGQAKGEIRAELDPAVEATVVLGMIRGLVTQWLLDRESIDLQRATRAALEACRRSLRAEPPR
ncbi:TetR family transcriptional regulator [Dankookia rubra]|uniref:TetR family transcriptional regulator n=1 Tax=Dankookia rubra TaxID=1442381 RepID=A0A4R5QGM4_9PROT|nr:TetR family transcriptional regulator C-terminal domain-containing protein [Dankookia rubra]TDH62073.1 TetR family transcriptional regulator [Dankookia rubra]